VVITGIGGNFGRAVARRLHRHYEIIGIDRRQVHHMPKDIDIENVDIRRRRAEDVFRRERIDAVVHLNIMHDPRTRQAEHHAFNIVGTQKIFELASEHRVPKMIVLSSANVYGPDPTNNQFLKEDAPLMGGQNFNAIRDLIALDMFCNTFFWRHPEIETVILRPVHIVGRVNNAPSRYLRLERPITVMGFDPMVQLIHVEDVVSAIERALTPGVRGVYNIAGPSPVPLSLLFEKMGSEPRPMPEPMARMVLKTAWSLKMSDWPVPELDHIKYVCMVDDTLARQKLGFEHEYALERILNDLERPPHY
jgi:UDP-glucose 4-epimerase